MMVCCSCRHTNIGSIKEKVLSIDGENLRLFYDNGDACENGKKASTEIILICDKLALVSTVKLLSVRMGDGDIY